MIAIDFLSASSPTSNGALRAAGKRPRVRSRVSDLKRLSFDPRRRADRNCGPEQKAANGDTLVAAGKRGVSEEDCRLPEGLTRTSRADPAQTDGFD